MLYCRIDRNGTVPQRLKNGVSEHEWSYLPQMMSILLNLRISYLYSKISKDGDLSPRAHRRRVKIEHRRQGRLVLCSFF